MKEDLTIKRTKGLNPDFQTLITHLDNELWSELKEDQATYDQFNKVTNVQTVLVLYINEQPAACGCFKKFDPDTVEIKRMFVEKQHRGQALAKRILEELENWAKELGFKNAVLETSIHFKPAQSLYEKAGYSIIKNYGQYEGLEESVCMKKVLINKKESSEFKELAGVEYFDFEEDFIEQNMRCIPMIVRFKMDTAGIKLKLSEWSKFSVEERMELAKKVCRNEEEAKRYNDHLAGLVKKYTGREATFLDIDKNPAWADINSVPEILNEKIKELGCKISTEQWSGLSDLQRFALLKLCKEGHENKNFSKAMKEFKLV